MRLLVISPHRDDACFSLAMTLLQCVDAGARVLLLNCFTRSCYAPLSDAEDVHMNDRMAYVSALRKREDELFARRLGDAEMVDLNLKDAPIRLHCPVSEVCSRQINPQEKAFLKVLSGVERVIASWRPDAISLPLALGGHVDHVTAREALLPLATEIACAFYEDLPYAGRPEVRETIEQATRVIGERCGAPLSPMLLGAKGGEERKRSFGAIYASQVDAGEVAEMVGFASRYGGHERVWGNAGWVNAFASLTKEALPESAATSA